MPPTPREQMPFRRPRRTRPGRVLAAIALAVLLHAVLLLLLVAAQHLQLVLPPEPPRPTKQAVALRTLTPQQWAQNRGQSADVPPNAVTPPKKKERTPDKTPDGQVVAVAPGNDQKPNDSKFLAESNNTVKKETRARDTTPNYKNPMPHRTTTTPVPKQGPKIAEKPHPVGNGGKGQQDTPERDASRQKNGGLEIPDVKPRDRIAMRTPEDGQGPGLKIPNQAPSDELHGNSHRFHLDTPGQRGEQPGEDGSQGRAGNPALANLVPTPSMLDKIDGAPANDHLDGVDEGDQTLLNTQEWKYAGFFNRVKQEVGTQWDPGSVLHERDPSGQVYGSRDRYTLLTVTLTRDGNLKDVHVVRSSGLEFLDEEAIHAFQKAQPFPNPPPGLLASDQLIHFQFGFFLQMSGMHGLRLFR